MVPLQAIRASGLNGEQVKELLDVAEARARSDKSRKAALPPLPRLFIETRIFGDGDSEDISAVVPTRFW
jgi:hypothetical protein